LAVKAYAPESSAVCEVSKDRVVFRLFKKIFAYLLKNIDMLGELGWNSLKYKISNL